jgi:hypothetical protein
MQKSDTRNLYKELFIILISSISILPFMTRSFTSIKFQSDNLLPALDTYYYQRIFNLNNNLFSLGDIYVDSINFSYRQINIFSFGEAAEKILFHLLGNNLILTYFTFSFCLLFGWIFLITRLLKNDKSISFYSNVIITSLMLVLFLGNSNLLNRNYPFARIISPQISLFLWLLGLILMFKIVASKGIKTIKYANMTQFGVLLLVSSFTYLYTFMALLSTSAVLTLIFAIQKRYKSLIWFIIIIVIGVLPFIAISFLKSKEERFQDAAERMGLINSHFPGSIVTFLICAAIVFIILASKRFKIKLKNLTNLELSLFVSSIGLILASQSNILTGSEVQFYHFNIFAKMNLLLLLLMILSRIKYGDILKSFHFLQVSFIALVASILILNSFSKIFLPLVFINRTDFPMVAFYNKYKEEERLIVDVANLQNNFPVYSKAKILYQIDITAYGYTSEEVLDRAFISYGCPSEISEDIKSELKVYRVDAANLKSKNLEKYMKLIHIDTFFANAYESILYYALDKRNKFEFETESYLRSVSGESCISMANRYKIDRIIFDKESNWYNITKLNMLPITSFSFQGLNLYEYILEKNL